MAITRRSAIAKEEPQSTPLPPPPPSPPPPPAEIAEFDSNSNVNNEQQQLQQQQQQPNVAETVSDYEQTREQRIKENRERLQKLGIVDLSLQLKSIISTKRTPRSNFERKTPLKSPSLGHTEPARRSSRLQNVPAITYTEPKEEKPRRNRDIVLEEGAKPEFYTEEHEKLLGNTEMPWTFSVDGYRADGTRIYDPVNGKTCHQCRQKTLGQRTHCCKCNLVQGQFCGDCLYARYGEHVVEANQNPNWICPPCRGICNCSLCRQAKGWAPTGMLYRRVNSLGFKSVAHYLIATKRAPPESLGSSDALQSAKRALPFEGMELTSDNGSDDKAVVVQTENDSTTVVESSTKSRGRPRKNFKIENTDAGEKSVKRSRGRPRKYPKKENTDAVEDSVIDNGESDPNSSAGVERPEKRSKKENIDAAEESVRISAESDLNSASVGRAWTRSQEESAADGAESVRVSGTAEEVSVSDMNSPNNVSSSNLIAGRSTRSSKKEIVEANAMSGDEPASGMKGPNILDSNAGSIATRLRART